MLFRDVLTTGGDKALPQLAYCRSSRRSWTPPADKLDGIVGGLGSNSTSFGGGNGLMLVVREGSPASGTDPGVSISDIRSPFVNDNGQLVLTAVLTGTGVSDANDRVILSDGDGNGLEIVAREGNPAPGTNPEVNFGDFFGAPVINGNGHVAFEVELAGTGIDSTNQDAIYSEGAGHGLAIVAREGSAAPGTASGVVFDRFRSTRTLNGN